MKQLKLKFIPKSYLKIMGKSDVHVVNGEITIDVLDTAIENDIKLSDFAVYVHYDLYEMLKDYGNWELVECKAR